MGGGSSGWGGVTVARTGNLGSESGGSGGMGSVGGGSSGSLGDVGGRFGRSFSGLEGVSVSGCVSMGVMTKPPDRNWRGERITYQPLRCLSAATTNLIIR